MFLKRIANRYNIIIILLYYTKGKKNYKYYFYNYGGCMSTTSIYTIQGVQKYENPKDGLTI